MRSSNPLPPAVTVTSTVNHTSTLWNTKNYFYRETVKPTEETPYTHIHPEMVSFTAVAVPLTTGITVMTHFTALVHLIIQSHPDPPVPLTLQDSFLFSLEYNLNIKRNKTKRNIYFHFCAKVHIRLVTVGAGGRKSVYGIVAAADCQSEGYSMRCILTGR